MLTSQAWIKGTQHTCCLLLVFCCSWRPQCFIVECHHRGKVMVSQLTNVKPFIPVLMTLCLQSCSHFQAFEISGYISVTPQACFTHVTGALSDCIHLTHDWCMLGACYKSIWPKAFGNQNVHVAYTTCLKLALNVTYSTQLVTHVKLTFNVLGIHPSS